MEATFLFFSSLTFAITVLFLRKLSISRHKTGKNKAPAPPSLPIIGHFHLLKQPMHRALQSISSQYGPVISLFFGYVPVVVISSSSAVGECLGMKDITFSDRPLLNSWKELSYEFTTVPTAPYGPLWRDLRRISVLEIFSVSRLNSFLNIRLEEVRFLVKNLHLKVMEHGGVAKVEIRPRLEELTFNIIMRMVSAKRYFGSDVDNADEAKRFRDIIRDVFELSAASDPGDFVPLLRWVGVGRQQKKRKVETRKRIDVFLQGLIDEHRDRACDQTTDHTKTIIDVMLELQCSEPNNYNDEIIKGMILTLLATGTDTSSVTLEWAMSLLLNNPATLKLARAELDSIIGEDRLIDEHDIQHLPYLQNIIHETLRLFPPAPLLLPHGTLSDTTVQGFDVAKGTIVFVNAWAIQRDPEIWDDPMSFKPERFEGLNQADYAHKMLPFGLGRRGCPGAGLAHKVLSLGLGALIQCFEWEREGEELVDLSEGVGLTIHKAQPLQVLCKSRNSMIKTIVPNVV